MAGQDFARTQGFAGTIVRKMTRRMKWYSGAVCSGVLILFPAFAQSAPPAGAELKQAEISQTETAIHISANAPRPLTQVLEALQQKYGWVVDYEDPPYADSDTVKVAGEQAGMSDLWLPAGGAFAVDVKIADRSGAAPKQDATLSAILDAYNHSKNPGRFELRPNPNGTFAVVGKNNPSAKPLQDSLLDLAISIPTQKRTAAETLDLILQQIAAQTQIQITVGVSPRRIVNNASVEIGGTSLPARTLLFRTLAAADPNLRWSLLFDPATKGYFLNIHHQKMP